MSVARSAEEDDRLRSYTLSRVPRRAGGSLLLFAIMRYYARKKAKQRALLLLLLVCHLGCTSQVIDIERARTPQL